MLSNYCKLMDISSELIQSNTMHFKSLIIDSQKFNHTRFSAGDVEKTFYKLMYQLIIHKFGSYFEENSKAIVHFDQRSSSYKLGDLLPILNAGIRKKYQLVSSPIRSLDPLDSKESDLIQIADILMGAIGFEKNGYHMRPNASPHKAHLARHISRRMHLPDLCHPTSWGRKDFEIWHFRFNS